MQSPLAGYGVMAGAALAGGSIPPVLTVESIDNGYVVSWLEPVRVERGDELAQEKATIDAATETARSAGVPLETIQGVSKLIRGALTPKAQSEPEYRLVRREVFCPTPVNIQALVPEATAAHARLREAYADGALFTSGPTLAG